MAAPEDERTMISERIAPTALPRVLNSLDMSVIFLAIVLFIVQASVIQPAGPAAFTYWILGFLLFLMVYYYGWARKRFAGPKVQGGESELTEIEREFEHAAGEVHAPATA